MKSFMQAFLLILLFLVLFESIGQISQLKLIRQKSYLAPLSLSIEDGNPVISDEFGTNSDLYRDQPIRLAAFGTSYTMGVEIPRKENWSRHIQAARPQLHLQNFSMFGTWSSLVENIEKAKSIGNKYSYVLISLTLSKQQVLDLNDENESRFLHSERFMASEAFPISLRLLNQIVNPKDAFLTFFERVQSLSSFLRLPAANAQAPSFGASKSFLTRSRMTEIKQCYRHSLIQSRCQERFSDALAKANRAPQELYKTIYLVCQAEVDRKCGVPDRVDFVPHFEVNQTESYYRQIKTLLDLTRPLADRQIVISQGLFSHSEPDRLYKMLGKNNAISLGVATNGNLAIALSTQSAWQRAMIRNGEIREAAFALQSENPNFVFLDFEGYLAKSGLELEEFFYDFAHLSPKGHRLYSDYLLQELGL